MKPWIPLLAGLSVSGAVLLAVWLEDPPPPVELPELAAPLPPPPPPAPLVRAQIPTQITPPQAPSPQASASAPVEAPSLEEDPQAFAEEAPSTSLDLTVDEPKDPAGRLRRAERVSKMLERRKERLREQLEAARSAGDPAAEARVRSLVHRSEERMDKVKLQLEQLRSQAEADPARQ